MKNIFRYILAVSIVGEMFVSCSLKEEAILPDSGKNNGSKLVVAHVADFSQHDVRTKATETEESQISELAMLVFGDVTEKDQETLEEETGKLITSPLFVDGEKLNFVINTTLGTNEEDGQYIANVQDGAKHSFAQYDGDLEHCRVYIVANMNTALENQIELLSTEKGFLDLTYKLLENVPEEGVGYSVVTEVPEGGFPMIGSADIDLRHNSELGAGSQEALTVTLKKLFAKIHFKFLIQVPIEDNPDHVSLVKIPYFEPTSWSVHNIPADFTLREDEEDDIPTNLVFKTQDFNTFSFSTELSQANKRIENSDDGTEYFEFSFYMPEYKVKALNNLPTGVDEKWLQGYKPTLCTSDQKPTYVHVKGKYSNHQGQISEVEYDLYLGQNEVDDFQIIRNQQLNNIATITGLTNHKGGVNVSLDWRVNINSSGYSIAMERETLLDSHFEFRRMDVSVEEGAVVVVKIPQDQNPWFAAESVADVIDSDLYDSTRPGLRMYFTPTLITELSGNREFVLRGPEKNTNDITEVEEHRLWFYFDENVANPYDRLEDISETNKLYREGKVLVDFYDNASSYENNGTPKQKDREYTFRQMNLWTINADINKYNIEYFEEYLYNYASDDNYGITTDGMEWGLDGKDLSTSYPAVFINKENIGGFWEGFLNLFGASFQNGFNSAFKNGNFYYDFYLARDNVSNSRDYAGISFTKEIANHINSGIASNKIPLSGHANSAVEYCFNKNKRNADGIVENVHWYLPSIDETEEILVDGFHFFPVFQSKWYWSSQPSYDKYNFNATMSGNTASGYYYEDNIKNARATIVTATSGEGVGAPSGVTGYKGTSSIAVNTINNQYVAKLNGEPSSGNQNNEVGNKPRVGIDAINRVRCAYSATPFPHIFGRYQASLSSGKVVEFSVCNSNDKTKGNVMLSNYIHEKYNDAYPLYGHYDKQTGKITINLSSQKVGTDGRLGDYNVYPRLYNVENNDEAEEQTLVFKYNNVNSCFELENKDNIRLGAYYSYWLFGTQYEISRGYSISSISRIN